MSVSVIFGIKTNPNPSKDVKLSPNQIAPESIQRLRCEEVRVRKIER